MPFDTPLNLIFNVLTLAVSMGFLIIVVWHDARRRVSQFFVIFLFFVQLWNVGYLLISISPVFPEESRFLSTALGFSQAGFVGASISIYALMAVIAGVQPRRFRLMTSFYLVGAVGYTAFLVRDGTFQPSRLQFLSFSLFFFSIFDFLALHIAWRYRQKLRSRGLLVGLVLFVLGQAVSILNPELGITSLSSSLGSIGALTISFSIIQRELINPLVERSSQFEAMHEVGVAITRRIATDKMLYEIAERAATWLGADASAIFLKTEDTINLVAIFNLPASILNHNLALGLGVSGTVAASKQSIYLENYGRDWDGVEDLPRAKESFGSVICVPLIYDDVVMGVLLVVSGVRGTLLDPADVRLVELLASQAAVAISYDTLFNEQRDLAEQLELAKGQLETVLTSTDNPVLAVDRSLNLIFTNPAADQLFRTASIRSRPHLVRAVPKSVLPGNFRTALRNIRIQGSHRYEINLDDKTYLCHVTSLGEERIEGFVAIVNDISELKELDRIKSEMVRMTSHDLKNPLQAALSNLELLREDLEPIDDEEVALSVNNIERQLHRMNRIISGILDLERVRLGANQLELCRPEKMIQDVIDELSDMAQRNQVTIVTEIDPMTRDFLGDVDQFKRSLINLVENAIKFNQPGGEVRIRVHNLSLNVIFIISDTGIGIPEPLINKIFERFYRGHQPGAEHISGSGLGLSLVKAVIESHKGRVWVESKPDVGTTFTVTVPATPHLESR